MKRPHLTIAILLVSILLCTLVSARNFQPIPGCQSTEIHQTYFWTLDDLYANCTYLQSATATLEIVLVVPFDFSLPILVVTVLFLLYRTARNHKFAKSDRRLVYVYLIATLSLSLLMSIALVFTS